MDFGLGSNALMGSSSDSLPVAPDSGTMERGSGPGLVRKRGRGLVENDGRKLIRTDDLGAAQSILFQTQGPLLRSNSLLFNEQQQPSYSSPQTGTSLPRNDALALDRSYQNHALHARNAGSSLNFLSCGVGEIHFFPFLLSICLVCDLRGRLLVMCMLRKKDWTFFFQGKRCRRWFGF